MPHDVGCVIWLTGLSGAGKSTLANRLAQVLRQSGSLVEILDGDHVRATLSRDLGFTRADRDENIRRIAYVAAMLARNRVVVIVAAISPYRDARERAISGCGSPTVEVFVDCSLAALEARDTKGLYALHASGGLSGFSGLSDPYEPPEAPDVYLRSDLQTEDECVSRILECFSQKTSHEVEVGFTIKGGLTVR